MAAIGKHIDVFPQTLKGLCIILVALIHLPWGQAGDFTGWLWISIRQIINFAVATFFFLSAYYTKPLDGSILAYYKKRFPRLLIPYLLWASIYILLIPFITTGRISESPIYYYLTGKGPTYFLLALAQFTLLNPILQRLKNNRIWNIVFWMITPLYVLFYYYYNFSEGTEFKPEQFFCFPWFACYYLGLKLQDGFLKRVSNIPPIMIFALCLIFLLLSNIEAFFIYKFTGIYSFAISQITVGSIIYSLGIIILFKSQWNYEHNNRRNLLTELGDYAMGIFLMHPAFNWIFKFIILHLPGGTILYSSQLGFLTIHIVVLFFSVSTSFFVSKFLSLKFPRLIQPLGLK